MEEHIELIKLIIAYTLVGAFVFTVIAACLALIFHNIFVDNRYRDRLFAIVIVEVALLGVGFFSDLLQFNPSNISEKIKKDAVAAKMIEQETVNSQRDQYADLSIGKVDLANGEQCKTDDDCTSEHCFPGPPDNKVKYCLAGSQNCAAPGVSGYRYGETLFLSGAKYLCYRPSNGARAQWRKL